MSFTRFKIDGYGQLELNFASFRRAGQIEAQCAIGKIWDSEEEELVQIPYIENGMFLAIDHTSRTVNYHNACIGYDSSEDYTINLEPDQVIYGLHYSSEHMYDERERGLKHFKLDANGPLPRMGYPNKGDKWTTNCLAYLEYDEGEYTGECENTEEAKNWVEERLADGRPVYGCLTSTGALGLVANKEDFRCVAKVVKVTTMPDGQWAVQFVAL